MSLWSLSPNYFNGSNANVFNVNSTGNLNNNNVNNTNGVRPDFHIILDNLYSLLITNFAMVKLTILVKQVLPYGFFSNRKEVDKLFLASRLMSKVEKSFRYLCGKEL